MKFLLLLISMLFLAGCKTTAPAVRTDELAGPPVLDGYELKWPQAPVYSAAEYQKVPMHRFSTVIGNITFSLSYATIPGLHDKFVDGALRDHAATHGFTLNGNENTTLANAEIAKTFAGSRDGLTVSGIVAAAGERLYLVMTEHDQTEANQVAASAAFLKSFRP